MSNSTFKNIILVTLFLGVTLFLFGCSSESFEFAEKRTIDDLSCSSMNLSFQEKEKINNCLSKWYYEDLYDSGFVGDGNNTVDYYRLYNIARMAVLLEDDATLRFLKSNLSFLEDCDVSEYGILNLVYYKYLCDQFKYEYNEKEMKSVLAKHYDKKECVFFLNSVSDTDSLKYTLSSLCVEHCSDLISDLLEEMKLKCNQSLRNTNFIMDTKYAFYSSGAGIIYYCNMIGVDVDLSDERIVSWFNYWKDIYESSYIRDLTSAASYSEFLKIAFLFDSNYSNEKINFVYRSLNSNQLDSIEDIQFVYNAIKYCTKLDNEEINSLILAKINSILSKELFPSRISVRSTAFGVAISKITGFNYNVDKVKNFLKEEYNMLLSNSNIYNAIESLYYLVGIDQIINGISHHIYDDVDIQNIINSLLGSLNYTANASLSDLMAVRYLVEVVSAIECLFGSVKLTTGQVDDIREFMNICYNTDAIKNSIYLLFVRSVDKRLGLNVVESIALSNAIDKLLYENGFKLDVGQKSEDIFSTFLFIKCIEEEPLIDVNERIKNLRVTIDYEGFEYCISNSIENLNVTSLYLSNYINNVNHSIEIKQ